MEKCNNFIKKKNRLPGVVITSTTIIYVLLKKNIRLPDIIRSVLLQVAQKFIMKGTNKQANFKNNTNKYIKYIGCLNILNYPHL